MYVYMIDLIEYLMVNVSSKIYGYGIYYYKGFKSDLLKLLESQKYKKLSDF